MNNYTPPEWMNDDLLEILGGRVFVVTLMSGERATTDINAALALLQVAIESQIILLELLHDKDLLK